MAPSSKESQPSGKTTRARAVKVGGKKKPRGGTRHGNGGGAAPAGGEGWGGPAKGPGKKDDLVLPGPGPGRGKKNAARAKEEAALVAEAMNVYKEIMRSEKEPANRISAATHLLNRLKGLPQQNDISSGELRIEISGGLRESQS
jgi:hypothetical protein